MASSDITASPSSEIDTVETRRIANEAARSCVPLLFRFPSIRRHSRSRTRTLPDGREVLRGAAYERRRHEVLERDDYTCVHCGSEYFVEVHHKQKRSILRDDRMDNLVTLCISCHSKEHQE